MFHCCLANMPVANGVFLPISHKRIRGSQNLDASPAVSLPSFLCAEMLRSFDPRRRRRRARPTFSHSPFFKGEKEGNGVGGGMHTEGKPTTGGGGIFGFFSVFFPVVSNRIDEDGGIGIESWLHSVSTPTKLLTGKLEMVFDLFLNFLETLTRAMLGYWAMVNLEKREKLFMGSLITWRQTFIEEILWEHKNTSFQFYFTFFEGKVEGALVSKKNHTHPFPFFWRDKKEAKWGGMRPSSYFPFSSSSPSSWFCPRSGNERGDKIQV